MTQGNRPTPHATDCSAGIRRPQAQAGAFAPQATPPLRYRQSRLDESGHAMNTSLPVATIGISITLMLSAVSAASSQQPTGLVLRHANVIDGVSREPMRDATIAVADGRIAAVGSSVDTPPGFKDIDLHGQWVLPGFIDAHTHVNSLASARTALTVGVTTLRTMQVNYYTDIAVRSLWRGGEADLPEILAGGYQLRPDMAREFFVDHPTLADLAPRVSGPVNLRRLVRANAHRGVDFIKILATERAGTPDTDPKRRTWTDEELVAIVDEATQYGLSVVAHAHGDEGAAAAVRAGVREVHHGTYMTDATLELMKSRGAWLVSTTALADTVPPSRAETDPPMWKRTQDIKKAQSPMLAHAWRTGVPIAAGTDGAYTTASGLTIVSEIEELIRIGIPPFDAISAATSRSAECAGISRRTGAIRAGLEADLIAVDGNPLRDPGVLRKVRLVVSDGHVILDKRNEP